MIRIAIAVVAVIALAQTARASDPIKIPFTVVQSVFKTAKCTIELQDEERTEVEELGGGLKLVEIYCWRAAYQAGSIFLAVDPKAPEKARLLRFHEWSSDRKRLISVYSLSNPSFDAAKKTMHMGHKGRGMGDCGVAGQWTWTGKDFMLTRFWNKPDCDGQPFDDDKKWQVYPPRGR
jgi:Protein of unknown function (DUF1176)